MNNICPVCLRPHNEDALQALTLLKCAERIGKKAKTLRVFKKQFEEFIAYLDRNNIHAVEARAYLVELEFTVNNLSDIRRNYFGVEKVLSNAQKMKERILGKRVREGEIRRPKEMCPVCFKFHFNSAEIPDKCWSKALKGDYSLAYEFNKFLQDNEFGELTL